MTYDFIKTLPENKSEINNFISSFVPTTDDQRRIVSEIKEYNNLISRISEQIVIAETEHKISNEIYEILKKFGKEVQLSSLRNLRKELVNDVRRLQSILQ